MASKKKWATSRKPEAPPPTGVEVEVLEGDIAQLKKKYQAVRQDNTYLRTQMQRMVAQLKRKDKQMQHILSIKVVGMTDKAGESVMSGRLKALKTEMMSISRLTTKVRDLEQELQEKEEELRLLKSSMKFTLIKELQIEAQTYFNEARRMKKLLDKRPRAASSGPRARAAGGRAGMAGVVEGSPDELRLLREEVKALRRESVYLRSERELEDKSYTVLQRLREKMGMLEGELGAAQSHISAIDEARQQQHQLAEMIVRNHENDEDFGGHDHHDRPASHDRTHDHYAGSGSATGSARRPEPAGDLKRSPSGAHGHDLSPAHSRSASQTKLGASTHSTGGGAPVRREEDHKSAPVRREEDHKTSLDREPSRPVTRPGSAAPGGRESRSAVRDTPKAAAPAKKTNDSDDDDDYGRGSDDDFG